MIDETLWRFLEYRKRKQAVIIATIITGLVVLWPAADEYMAARQRVRDAQSDLEESQVQVDKLPQFTQVLEKRREELRKLEKQAVDEKTAQNLRNELMQTVRKTGCTLRKIRLGDPTRRVWMENDHPINNTSIIDKGAETPFQLESRQMTITIEGTMSDISSFLGELSKIDRLAHSKSVSIRRTNKETQLDIDVMLFDLPRKNNG